MAGSLFFFWSLTPRLYSISTFYVVRQLGRHAVCCATGMTQKKSPQRRPDQATVQPQTSERAKKVGVPDEGSSKSNSTGQRDARSGHDKDGNAEQARRAAGGRRS
jgi:hypothetical protein